MKGTRERQRHGCDKCKKDHPTEYFQGALGHELWLCLSCSDDLLKWTSLEIATAKVIPC